eukprot:m.126930 g.126930  ORF g.126930 m.126930 type:complete len:1008 (-) comp14532_c0_seq1:96-3119(-)
MADSSIPETKWKRGGGRLSKMSKLPEKKKRNSGAYSRPVRDPSKGDGEGDPERHQWVWTRLSVVKVEKLLVDHAGIDGIFIVWNHNTSDANVSRKSISEISEDESKDATMFDIVTLSVRHAGTISHYSVQDSSEGLLLESELLQEGVHTLSGFIEELTKIRKAGKGIEWKTPLTTYICPRQQVALNLKTGERVPTFLQSAYELPENDVRELCGVLLREVQSMQAFMRTPPKSRTKNSAGFSAYYDRFREWIINYESIRLSNEPIGEGSYGIVYKGDWHGPVAVKLFKMDNPTDKEIQAFKNEVSALRRTRHRNILLFIGACVDRTQPLAIVTQWWDGTNLYEHIHNNYTEWLQLLEWGAHEAFSMTEQIVQGMKYLHIEKNIIHRDLKSPNILLNMYNDEPHVCIADFGLAMMKSSVGSSFRQSMKSFKHVGGGRQMPAGSVPWMAPEIIRMNTYSKKSDMYALGVILFELFTGEVPYQGRPMEQILFQVGMGKLKLDVSRVRRLRKPCKESIQLQIENCMKTNPDERPRFDFELLQEIDSWKIKNDPLSRRNALPHKRRSRSNEPQTPPVRASSTLGSLEEIEMVVEAELAKHETAPIQATDSDVFSSNTLGNEIQSNTSQSVTVTEAQADAPNENTETKEQIDAKEAKSGEKTDVVKAGAVRQTAAEKDEAGESDKPELREEVEVNRTGASEEKTTNAEVSEEGEVNKPEARITEAGRAEVREEAEVKSTEAREDEVRKAEVKEKDEVKKPEAREEFEPVKDETERGKAKKDAEVDEMNAGNEDKVSQSGLEDAEAIHQTQSKETQADKTNTAREANPEIRPQKEPSKTKGIVTKGSETKGNLRPISLDETKIQKWVQESFPPPPSTPPPPAPVKFNLKRFFPDTPPLPQTQRTSGMDEESLKQHSALVRLRRISTSKSKKRNIKTKSISSSPTEKVELPVARPSSMFADPFPEENEMPKRASSSPGMKAMPADTTGNKGKSQKGPSSRKTHIFRRRSNGSSSDA